MRWVEQFISIIPATRTRLVVGGLVLAAASFFYLAALANTEKRQVDQDTGSITSIADDADDTDSGPSWRCADVPIMIKCGNARAAADFKFITAPAR